MFRSAWAETVPVFLSMIYCVLTINLILMHHRYRHCPTFRSHSLPCWRCFRWCGCHGPWCGSMDSCCGWRSHCCWWQRWCWCRTLSWDVGNILQRRSVMMKMLLYQRYGFCIYILIFIYVCYEYNFLVPYIYHRQRWAHHALQGLQKCVHKTSKIIYYLVYCLHTIPARMRAHTHMHTETGQGKGVHMAVKKTMNVSCEKDSNCKMKSKVPNCSFSQGAIIISAFWIWYNWELP